MCSDEEKYGIEKYANENGAAASVQKFKKHLTEWKIVLFD